MQPCSRLAVSYLVADVGPVVCGILAVTPQEVGMIVTVQQLIGLHKQRTTFDRPAGNSGAGLLAT